MYLMRHGHAPTTAEAGVKKDALRPLSPRGREDARRMAEELRRRGGKPALILHSPLTRAVQTAAEAAAVLAPKKGVETFEILDNTRPAEEVARAIEERGAAVEEVLAVGHQPQLGEIAALLGRSLFAINPAGIVALETDPETRALWSLNPEDL